MQDVWRVIRSTKPTVAMIELDEERLNRMRQVPRVQQMTPEQLQQASGGITSGCWYGNNHGDGDPRNLHVKMIQTSNPVDSTVALKDVAILPH